MKHFDIAVADVLKHEGGRVDHPLDNGGDTNLGISLRFLRNLPDVAGDITGDGHVNSDDIAAMTPATAVAFYRAYFWEHYRLGEIHDLAVAIKLFHFFVNMRGKTAGLVAQRAVNDIASPVYLDGVVGSKTLAAINACAPSEYLVCLKWRAWEVYRAIIQKTPSQSVFSNGWRQRAFA